MLTADQSNKCRRWIVITAFIAVILLALIVVVVKAQVLQDPCSRENLFPVAVINSTFNSEPGRQPVPGRIYTFWDLPDEAPGNFSWVYWVDGDGVVRGTPPQNASINVLEENIVDTTRSGSWRAGDWVHGTGGADFAPVLDELDARINGPLVPTVTIPIYNQVQGYGSDVQFRMVRYSAFRLVCAKNWHHQMVWRHGHPEDCDPCLDVPSSIRCLRGYFVRWVEPPVATFCSNTGP